MFDEPAYCATEQTKFIPDKPQASNGDLPVMPQIGVGSDDAAKSIGGSDAAKAAVAMPCIARLFWLSIACARMQANRQLSRL